MPNDNTIPPYGAIIDISKLDTGYLKMSAREIASHVAGMIEVLVKETDMPTEECAQYARAALAIALRTFPDSLLKPCDCTNCKAKRGELGDNVVSLR